jgi:hypothetical protein
MRGYWLTLDGSRILLTVMARGLSELQRAILVLAHRNRNARLEIMSTLDAWHPAYHAAKDARRESGQPPPMQFAPRNYYLSTDLHEERISLTRGAGSIDVYIAEILHEHFGFPLKDRSYGWRKERGERPGWGQIFSMTEIGEKRYRSAQVSTSRAVGRLQARGLVKRWYSDHAGLSLTDEGVKTAEELSVNTPTLGRNC